MPDGQSDDLASRETMVYPPWVNRPVNVITSPERLPLVAPSILAADFAHLAEECRAVLDGGADALHLDVMDGHFVPNLTMGPVICESLRRVFPEVCLDVHLMVQEPAKFVRPFADAGASNLTFHIEVQPDPRPLAEEIHRAGMTAGLAINPPTPPLNRVVDSPQSAIQHPDLVAGILPFIDHFDVILVMSVNPGYAGQSFIEEVLERTRAIAPGLRQDQRLAMDGGISPENATRCRDAGCDMLVAATAVFGAHDYAHVIDHLRTGALSSATLERPHLGAAEQ